MESLHIEYHDFGLLGHIPRLEKLLPKLVQQAIDEDWDFDDRIPEYAVERITMSINGFCAFAIDPSRNDDGENDGGEVAIFHRTSKAAFAICTFTEDQKPTDQADAKDFCDYIMNSFKSRLDLFKNFRNVKFCRNCARYLPDDAECADCNSFYVPHPQLECSVCLTSETNKWCMLPCKHEFHYACIRRLEDNICPLCRAPFKIWDINVL